MFSVKIFISCAFFILGAILASFTGVVSERVFTGQSWLRGRSRCNACRRVLDVLDLVPVLSWLVFAGKCRSCRAPVPLRYALSEAILGTLFMLSYLRLGFTLRLVVFLLALIVLAFTVLYDLRHTIVPIFASTSLIVLGALFAWLSAPIPMFFEHAFFAAIGIGLVFLIVHYASRGRAMGLGDAPIAFGLSLLVGSPVMITAFAGLLYSFWIGAIIGIVILVFRRGGPTMGIEVPFVPFLAAGYLIAFFTQTAWNVILYRLF